MTGLQTWLPRGGRALRALPRLLAWACFAWAWAGVHAGLPEPDLKAQVMVRALMFAQWPAGTLVANEPLVLCVPDDHPLAAALMRQEGQMINGHRLQPRRGASEADRPCHAALVATAGRAAAGMRRSGLLLIGDVENGLKDGVMLNVQLEAGRVVFDVNLKAARDDGLDFDVRLLRLARFVRRD